MIGREKSWLLAKIACKNWIALYVQDIYFALTWQTYFTPVNFHNKAIPFATI